MKNKINLRLARAVLTPFVLAGVLAYLPAYSQDAAPTAGVEWFAPETAGTKGPGITRLMISGKTQPGAKVVIPSKSVQVMVGKKLIEHKLDANKDQGSSVTADKEGLFQFYMDLPVSYAQLPIEIATEPNKPGQKYQLNLFVESESVRVEGNQKLKKSIFSEGNYATWFGVGTNLLRYRQSSSTLSSDVKFESIDGPSYFLMGSFKFGPKWLLNISGEMSPGATSSSDQIIVSKGSYSWTIFSLEGVYKPERWRFKIKGRDSQVGFRFGAQHHTVPFVSRTAVNGSVANVDVLENSMLLGAIGFDYWIRLSSRWNFEMYMMYQTPVTVGDVFNANSFMMFNGSVGAYYKFNGNKWRLGGYWYGQSHDYDFTHQDKVLGSEISGHQNTFFSKAELRLGYDFE